MQYLGNKNKLSKYILPIMLKNRFDNQWWIEPFVGGANIIDKVSGNRIGNDNNKYLISLLESVKNGWNPPTNVSKESYYDIKNNIDSYSPELVGFVGFLCSFGGKWWGGYAHNTKNTNYAEVGYRSLLKQSKLLIGVNFKCVDYLKLEIPKNSLIYCDPPYRNTVKYHNKDFDHDIFWQWCRDMKKEGHDIFISEYSAPEDFKCVFEKEHISTLNKNKKDIKIEKLFTL